MWFKDVIISSRIWKSFLWTAVLQETYTAAVFLLFNLMIGKIFSGLFDCLIFLIHWKVLCFRAILVVLTLAFGASNLRFYCVEKHVPLTQLEKCSGIFNPSRIQHFFLSAALGGVTSYCWFELLRNFDFGNSWLTSLFQISSAFDETFIIYHGVFTGMMFTFKYFICSMHHIGFKEEQERLSRNLKHCVLNILKDSVVCVLKSLLWFYLVFYIFINQVISCFGITLGLSPISESPLYSVLSIQLFVSLFTGVIIYVNWSLYITVFNFLMSEGHKFPIEVQAKTCDKNKTLSSTLLSDEVGISKESHILKYLAVLDLRLLAENDVSRRKEIFAISFPGGHPYQWKAISGFCIAAIKKFAVELQDYSMLMANNMNPVPSKGFNNNNDIMCESNNKGELACLTQKICASLKQLQVVSYFITELPSSKIRRIFSKSLPIIWSTEALGYLVAASCNEDSYGVVQQTLPEIICSLLDLRNAEERLPREVLGIHTHVKDPQGRHEHIHQRSALKNAVNISLHRIADAFADDINGICLPDEYERYFQRYLKRKER